MITMSTDNSNKAVEGIKERKLIYCALLIACGVIALAAGPVAGLWSFAQVAIMIELAHWFGTSTGVQSRRRW
ncbi:MAG: hypothetical protein HKN19_04310 [Halioglobus sp.]|nr:hypothetical protein [Halioglobus sp.]